jgi:hypothetical protein
MATLFYAETRDLRVIGAMLGHRSDRTTKHYTIAAVAPHVPAAAERGRQRLASDLASTVTGQRGIIAEFCGRHGRGHRTG